MRVTGIFENESKICTPYSPLNKVDKVDAQKHADLEGEILRLKAEIQQLKVSHKLESAFFECGGRRVAAGCPPGHRPARSRGPRAGRDRATATGRRLTTAGSPGGLVAGVGVGPRRPVRVPTRDPERRR